MKVLGWIVTVLGWYFILGAVYAVVRSLSRGGPFVGVLIDIAIIGGIALALGVGLINWGKRLRAKVNPSQ